MDLAFGHPLQSKGAVIRFIDHSFCSELEKTATEDFALLLAFQQRKCLVRNLRLCLRMEIVTKLIKLLYRDWIELLINDFKISFQTFSLFEKYYMIWTYV